LRAPATALPALSEPRALAETRARVSSGVQKAIPTPRTHGAHVVRSRAYAFVLDANGQPQELGSGRFAKAYLGEERWL
jgi:hypothetical protein